MTTSRNPNRNPNRNLSLVARTVAVVLVFLSFSAVVITLAPRPRIIEGGSDDLQTELADSEPSDDLDPDLPFEAGERTEQWLEDLGTPTGTVDFAANNGDADTEVDYAMLADDYSAVMADGDVLLVAEGQDLVGALHMEVVGGAPEPDSAQLDTSPIPVDPAASALVHDPNPADDDPDDDDAVSFDNVLPGIDVVYSANDADLEYSFVIEPGADPAEISLDFHGATELTVQPDGDLLITTDDGPDFISTAPVTFQEVGGVPVVVDSGYLIRGDGTVGFQLGAYDPTLPVIIDPTFIAVETAGGTFTSASTIDLPVPAGITAGDLLVAQVVYNAPDPSVITPSAGWTVVDVVDHPSADLIQGLYWRVATGGEPAQYSFTLTAGGTGKASGAIAGFSDVDTGNPIDAFGSQSSSSSSIVAPSVTATVPGATLIGFFAARDAGPVTPPFGMTERWDAASGGGGPDSSKTVAEAAEEQLVAAGATGTRTASFGATQANIGTLVALTPTGTVTVNSTADTGDATTGDDLCDTGGTNSEGDPECTLRAAIEEANASAVVNAIHFAMPTTESGHSGGVWTVDPGSALPSLAAALTIDGSTQPGWAATPIIELDGTSAGATTDGFEVGADDITIRSLAINRFGADGIEVTAGAADAVIAGNHIGLDATGLVDRGNGARGIDLQSGSGPTTVGGIATVDRNVISGNGDDGMVVWSSNDNVIIGNLFGTDVTGNASGAGIGNGSDGIVLGGTSSGNTIGQPGSGNVLSGNGNDGFENDATGANNTVQANTIGLGEDGTTVVANGRYGVVMYNGANNTMVGGSGAGERNVISGNVSSGVIIDGNGNPATTANTIAGNLIGTDATGLLDRGNGAYGVHLFDGANANTIGGSSAAHGNVVSGNGGGSAGIFIDDAATANNVIQHNSIGVNETGTAAISNNLHGVRIEAPNTQVLDNLISGNDVHGIYIFSADATGTQVLRNSIGTNGTATAIVPNGFDGIRLEGGSSGSLIGTAGNGNVIGGNDHGININDSNGNTIQGNHIGTNAGGTVDLGNTDMGIYVPAFNSSNNLIGWVGAGAGNTIAFNDKGIHLESGTGNAIIGNAIHANTGLGIDLTGDGVVTPNDGGDGDNGANDLLNFPVVTGAVESGGTVTVDLDLDVPAGSYRVEVFTNPSGADPSGHGEGEAFGSGTTVAHTGSGSESFQVTYAGSPGDVIALTTTEDLGGGSYGSSSEFSAVATVSCPATDSDGDGLLDCEEDANTDADDDPATNPGPDTDGDTIPNHLDADDDGDGTPTASENADPNADGDPRDARDVDRDGEPDYLDAPTARSDGTVQDDQKISDTTGGLVAALDNSDNFGSDVAPIGDLDGDGVVDLISGARGDDDGAAGSGAAYVLFLNADGTVKAEQKISNSAGGLTATLDGDDNFGRAVAGIGDIDGDGLNDVAVGAHFDDDGDGDNSGAVYILFLNADGTVKAEQKISETAGGLGPVLDGNDYFGRAVAGVGDLDGDGIGDLAVGAYLDDDGASSAGAVYILFLNANGTVKAEQKVSNTAGTLGVTLDGDDHFGRDVAAIGDVDGDGIMDLGVGANGDDDGGSNRGAAYVLFLNADGTVSSTTKISSTAGGLTGPLADGDYFGIAVGSAGDIGADGTPDLVVGAERDSDGGTERGALHVLSLNGDGTVKAEQKISDTAGSFTATLDDGDRLGAAVAGVGDLDGDGIINLAFGVNKDDDGGNDRGAVYVVDLSPGQTVVAAVDDAATTTTGTAKLIDVATNDVEVNGEAVTVVDAGDPGNGTATTNGDGTVTYRSDPAYTGADVFDYWAIDAGASLSHYWGLAGDGVDAIGTANGVLTGTTSTAGNFGQALSFDEIDDRVTVPDFAYTSDFTLSFDFKLDDNTGSSFQYVYSHGDINSTDSINVFFLEDTHGTNPNVLRTVARDGDDTLDNTALQTNIAGLVGDGQWHTYTLVADSTSGLTVFLDGVSVATDPSRGTGGTDPTGSAYFGARQDLAADRWYGAGLDTVQIYDRALANTEVADLANQVNVATTTMTVNTCPDSDGDGLLDCEEDANTDLDADPATNPGPDTDGDTTPNHLDADDDGDGTATSAENADPNTDGDPRDALDSDWDGQPDYLDEPTSAATATVSAEQKISSTQGGLAGPLGDGNVFGTALGPIGDVDSDGIVDVFVGTFADDDGGTDRGAAYVLFMNADGTVKSEQKISDTQGGLTEALEDGDYFGHDGAGIGDLDGDGTPDLAVGAIYDDDGGTDRGAVYILFLNPDGTVRAEQKISDSTGGLTTVLGNSDYFGASLTTVGDLDGDGLGDVVVGAMGDDDGGNARGAAYVLFLNADGTVKGEQKISSTTGSLTGPLDNADQFGETVAVLGDIDGDSVIDIAVGSHEDDDGGAGRGAVYVLFLNTDGTVKGEQKISSTTGGLTGPLDDNDSFGIGVDGIGDFDGDGVGDMVASAYFDDDGGSERGAVYIISLDTDGTVKAEQKISSTVGGLTGPLDDDDYFGNSVGGLGDLDGDGAINLAVGAPLDDDGGTDRGAVYMLDLSIVAGTVEVNSTGDGTDATPGDGLCDTGGTNAGGDPECTLRAAIEEANASATIDTIEFTIPATDSGHSSGIWTITPGSGLPWIGSAVDIDATTQSGYSSTPVVVLDGSGLSGTERGLGFNAAADDSRVAGLSIHSFPDDSISSAADRIVIEDNHVGVLPDGTTAPGSGSENVALWGGVDSIVRNNLIAASGGVANVAVSGSGTSATLDSNIIGTDASGTLALGGGQGVWTDATGAVSITGNTIAHNSFQGVQIASPAATVSVLGNEIRDNGMIGIDLAAAGDTGDLVTANDAGDGDTGPNALLNFPVITAASVATGTVTVDFDLDSPAGDYRVEFFTNPSGADPSGNGEGEVFAHAESITHTGSGAEAFSASFAGSSGAVLTTTATEDQGGGSYGPTSEFSAAVAASCGTTDTDSDGLLDCEEDANTDADDDPSTNPGPDTDGDTTPNYLDADDDGDGTPTASENADPNADGDPRDALDSDRDGQPDYLDAPTTEASRSVADEQKISDTEGGLSAVLVDSDGFGSGAAPIGDLDDDGIVDLIVGADQDDTGASGAGAVHVLFMNADGTVKGEQKITNGVGGLSATLLAGDGFGSAVAAIGDIDGDGIEDVMVSADQDDTGGGSNGAVYVLLLNADGTVKAEQKVAEGVGGLAENLNDNSRFGSSVTGLGDLDGDGINDAAVGAAGDDTNGVFTGAIYVLFLNADGSVKAEQKITHGTGGLSATIASNDTLSSAAGIGDLDGDGVEDLVAGAYATSDGGPSRGAVYVLFLNTDGTVKAEQKISDTSGGLTATLDDSDFFGLSLGALGDHDADGAPDIAVGATWDDDGGSNAGTIYLLGLNTDGTVKTEQKVTEGVGGFTGPLDDWDLLGGAVAGIGDLDGDGAMNLVVGAGGDDDGGSGRGAVYVLDLSPGPCLTDSDGDGLWDCEEDANTDADDDPSTNPGPDTDGDTTPNHLDADDDGDGTPTASENADPNADGDPRDALDSDRDGQPDWLDGPIGIAAMLVAGEQRISDTAGGLTATLDDGDELGRAVAALGDLDGDGITDVVAGMWSDDDGGTNRGAVHILFLNADGTVKAEQKISDTTGGLTATLDDGDAFGHGLAVVGDLDGDGIHDLAVGAQRDDDGGTDRGSVHILFLNADGTVKAEQKISDTTGGLTTTLDDDDLFGHAVGTVGDVDGDGIPDLAVTAHLDDDGGTNRGSVHILFLNADGTVKAEQKISDTTGGLTATLADNDRLGMSVAGLGDINGDGTMDLIVGASTDDDGGSNRGAVHILFLDSDGTVKAEQEISGSTGGFPDTVNDWDEFGYGVAGIGDLDGDGINDAAIGARYNDTGGTNHGALWLIALNSDGTVKGAQVVSDGHGGFVGPLADDGFGSAIAGIGDLDGDGPIGLVVGAPSDDDGGANRGAMYVLDLATPNNAPVLDNSGTMTFTSITEDDFTNNGNTVAELIVSAGGDRITDADGDPEGVLIESATSGGDNGWFEFSLDGGTTWTRFGQYLQDLPLRDSDRIRFVPAGFDAETASITFRAWDRTSGTAGTFLRDPANGGDSAFSTATETASITTTAVGDAPVFGIPAQNGPGGSTDSAVTVDVDGLGGTFEAVAEAPDGTVVAAGHVNDDVLLVRFAADGSVVSSFGDNGYVVQPIGTGTDQAHDVAVQADGKIVVVGRTNSGTDDALVARFDTDGTLDTTFGGGDGWASVPTATFAGVAIQGDGRIAAVGSSSTNLLAARFDTDGTLDGTFGSGGTIVHGSINDAADLALQADGKLVVATDIDGVEVLAVARLTTTGAVDTGFGGGDGVAETSLGLTSSSVFGSGVAMRSNGDILVTGTAWDTAPAAGEDDLAHTAIARFDSSGAIDTTFGGGDGYVLDPVPGGSYGGGMEAIAIQPDGDLVTAGYFDLGYKGQSDPVVARHLVDGTIDTGFDTDGFALTAAGRHGNHLYDVIVATDGDIVAVGRADSGTAALLIRYDGSGATDAVPAAHQLDASPTHVQGAPPTVLDGDVTVHDRELTDFATWTGTSLTIARQGGADAADQFSATGDLAPLTEGGSLIYDGTTIGTVTANSGGTLVLDFTANSNQTRVGETMDALAYANTTSPPGVVTMAWTFDDGTGATANGTVPVTLTALTATVNSTGDGTDATPGDGLCHTGGTNSDGADECTLRAAIEESNAVGGASIEFAIPVTDAGYSAGPPAHWVIRPAAGSYPAITGATTIDAGTQPGWAGDPVIELDGSLRTGTDDGLLPDADAMLIRGLSITNWPDDGVHTTRDGVRFEANWFGVDPTGATAANQSSDLVLWTNPTGVVIGGATTADGNVFAAAGSDDGIILSQNSVNTDIVNNRFGIGADGSTDLGPTGEAIIVTEATNTTIRDNVFANTPNAAVLQSNTSTGTIITGNSFGLDDTSGPAPITQAVWTNSSGTLRFGGTGVGDGNTVRNAGDAAVSVDPSATGAVTILGNSIARSTNIGIDLNSDWVTANDAGDVDTGANGLLNFPVITSTGWSGGTVTVDYDLDVPAGNYRIELFVNPSGADPSGYGEGETLVHSDAITHTGSGVEAFSTSYPGTAGVAISATTTEDLGGGSYGATSEFSLAVVACDDPDGDGLCTVFETPYGDTDGDTTANPDDADDDGDGTPTASENADPNADGSPRDARDADHDGQPDYLDRPTGTAGSTVVTERKIGDGHGDLTATLDGDDRFGSAVAAIGDLDQDGIVDLAVGTRADDDGGTDRGAVHILFLNADGTVKAEQKIANATGGLTATLDDGDGFGSAVAAIGDLDQDGIVDLAVGTRADDDGGTDGGAVHILFLNADGTVKAEQKIANATGGLTATLADNGWFGGSVATIGDLDGDGLPDLAVGAHGSDELHILFLQADGTVKAEQLIADGTGGLTAAVAGDGFGGSVSGAGDLDGDGVEDVIVGASGEDDGGPDSGAIHVLMMNADGTVKAEQKVTEGSGGGPTLDNNDAFGASAAALGDLYGGGSTVVAVGATGDDDGGPDRGALYLLAIDNTGTAVSVDKLSETSGGLIGPRNDLAQLGAAVASVGDLDGDGTIGLAVAAPVDDGASGVDRGAVYVLDLGPDPAVDSDLLDDASLRRSDLAPAGGIDPAITTTGIVAHGLAYGGGTDRLVAPATDIGSPALTLSAWINATGFGTDPRVVAKASTDGNAVYELLIDDSSPTTGQAQARLRLGGTTHSVAGGSVVTGGWHHLVTTWDGASLTLYVDGTAVDSTAAAGTIATDLSVPLTIGNLEAADRGLNGIIDEVRVTHRADGPERVAFEYTNLTNPGSVVSVGGEQNGAVDPWTISGAQARSGTNAASAPEITVAGVDGWLTATGIDEPGLAFTSWWWLTTATGVDLAAGTRTGAVAADQYETAVASPAGWDLATDIAGVRTPQTGPAGTPLPGQWVEVEYRTDENGNSSVVIDGTEVIAATPQGSGLLTGSAGLRVGQLPTGENWYVDDARARKLIGAEPVTTVGPLERQ